MRSDISEYFPIIIKGSGMESFPWKNVFTESNVPNIDAEESLTISFDDSNHLIITWGNECDGNISFGDEDKNILTEQLIKIFHGKLIVDCDYADIKKYLLAGGSILVVASAIVAYAAFGDHSGFRLRRIKVWLDPAGTEQILSWHDEYVQIIERKKRMAEAVRLLQQ